MKVRKSLLFGFSVATLASAFAATTTNAAVGIYLNVAPPTARYEAVPPPRRGYQWAPGYWNSRHNRHVWQSGHWERQRAGYHYSAPSWTQRDNRWELQRGRWERGDSDGDGTPNGVDRAPNNPNRR